MLNVESLSRLQAEAGNASAALRIRENSALNAENQSRTMVSGYAAAEMKIQVSSALSAASQSRKRVRGGRFGYY